MKLLLALALVGQSVAVGAAGPANDQLGFDVRCMVASQAASDRLDGGMKVALEMAVMYFFGRVDAVLAGPALEERLQLEARSLEGAPLGPLLKQCGQFMKERGKTLEEIGAKLEAREKALRLQ